MHMCIYMYTYTYNTYARVYTAICVYIYIYICTQGLAGVLLDLRLGLLGHVAVPALLVDLPLLGGLDHEASAEDVRQLRAEPVATASHLLLGVVVVVAGQQVAKDELWYEHLVRLVDLDRQALAVVPDLDPLVLGVDLHPDAVHVLVALHVVSGVDLSRTEAAQREADLEAQARTGTTEVRHEQDGRRAQQLHDATRDYSCSRLKDGAVRGGTVHISFVTVFLFLLPRGGQGLPNMAPVSPPPSVPRVNWAADQNLVEDLVEGRDVADNDSNKYVNTCVYIYIYIYCIYIYIYIYI